jgi:predicted RNA-binding protein with PIN domain
VGEGEQLDGILIVDGYNVINSWPELVALIEDDMSHARDRLVAILADFCSFCRMRVIVVFDAHLVKGGMECSEKHLGVEVVYTKEGETADSWIEKFTARHYRERSEESLPIFVITYDWMEQRVVSAQGAYRVTPQELWQEIQRIKREEERYFEEPCDRITLDNFLSGSIKNVFEGWRRHKFRIP